jgi:hypothetical protein
MEMYRADRVRTARFMAAALSRRRALKGIAGATSLGLLGHLRRERAAAAAVFPLIDDLAAVVPRPSDVPDLPFFGLDAGTYFVGVAGGIDSQLLDERTLTALNSNLEALAGGYYSRLAPLDGSGDPTLTTQLFQFTGGSQARQALDAMATDYFAGLPEVTPDGVRGRYFAGTFEQGGNVFIRASTLFGNGPVVGVVTLVAQAGDPQLTELPDPIVTLAQMRDTVVSRLRDGDPASPAGTIPTTKEIADAVDGRLGPGPSFWTEGYLQREGVPQRWAFQTEEKFDEFGRRYARGRDSLFRIEAPPVVGGNGKLLVTVDVTRFDDDQSATQYFASIPGMTAEEAAADPDGIVSIPTPPPATPELGAPAHFFVHQYTLGANMVLGTRAWVQNGSDVAGIFLGVVAEPCPPGKGADPEDDGQSSPDDGAEPDEDGLSSADATDQIVELADTLTTAAATVGKAYDADFADILRQAKERRARQIAEEELANDGLALCSKWFAGPLCIPLMTPEARERINLGSR